MSGTILYLPAPRTMPDVVVPGPVPKPADVTGWSQIDVTFTGQPRRRTTTGIAVADVLDGWCAQGGGRWWFLNQDRGWRVYLQGQSLAGAVAWLNETGQFSSTESWRAVPAHPPTAAASVRRGRNASEARALVLADLHCADSQGVLDYLREDHPLLVPRHLAGVLTVALCHAAGLSTPQTADFVDQHWLDTTPLGESARVQAYGLAEMLGAYLLMPATHLLELDPYSALWTSALAGAGERLRILAHQGSTCAPSAVVPDILQYDLRLAVAAHWNRLGLTAQDQQVLAVAIRNALWATEKR